MTSTVKKPQRHFRLFILTAGLCLLVAQLVGYWVNASIPEGSSLQINALLNFTHVRNHGGVFGMAQGQGWLFGALSVLLLAGVCAYLWFGAVLARVEYLCFGLIVGGGASIVGGCASRSGRVLLAKLLAHRLAECGLRLGHAAAREQLAPALGLDLTPAAPLTRRRGLHGKRRAVEDEKRAHAVCEQKP